MFTPQEATILEELLRDKLQSKSGHISQGELKEHTAVLLSSILAKIQPDLPKQKVKHPAKVLVIDDVESMRYLNIQIMKKLGFEEVDFASSARKGQQMMQQAVVKGEPFGLVLADWDMPKMSGLDLLKEIRQDPELRHTPYFLITAMTEKSHVIEAIKNGVTGYLTKPISHSALLEKVKRFL